MQGSVLLDAVFIHFWKEGKTIIIRRAFLPFLIYFIVANFYYTQCLLGDAITWTFDWSDSDFVVEFILFIFFCVTLFQQILRKVYQFAGEKRTAEFFSSGSNRADTLSILLNTTTLALVHLEYLDLRTMRLFASISLLLLYLQFFFWLRISDLLAQYVDLIIVTYQDMKLFLCVLILFIIMFSAGFYMVQLNRNGTTNVFTEDDEGGWATILRIYYMVLGDFGDVTLIRSEKFEDESDASWYLENAISISLFFGATAISSITILNMLISIMAVTLT